MNDLAKRIQRLEDIEAIKQLRARYCYLVDQGRSEELLALFTADAKGEYGPLGTYDKAGLANFFKQTVPAALPFCMHMVHNPVIEVHGSAASGQWYFEVPAIHGPSERAVWISGRYEEEYRKEGNAGWQFSLIRAIFNYFTPFDEGWARTRMMGQDFAA